MGRPKGEPTETRLPYRRREECEQPEWEGEWERVLRRREEQHPLMLGGNYRHIEKWQGYGGNKPLYDSETFNHKKDRHYTSN